ncbi:MAG: FAD-dependent oxidoreductase [Pseudomonas sp.]|uniref:FAD-dependent oxidoreductase n=1 Tax=Pseudomonas sp. TaxID=306 RepID=UPI002737017C|nr:FAD-dependent oxidoreductase [Pseudomonas sp.]MDP3848048.1 FAD-dependent oxidoreductase [Pseudomonas sp.]
MGEHFDLLLAGAGHAHLGVLRQWAVNPKTRPAGHIGLLSADAHAWYSGMLPGLLRGRYALEQCRIGLTELCTAAGVELLLGQACGLEPAAQQLQVSDGRQLQYRYLSLNLGSQPLAPTQYGSGLELLPVKPFSAFIARWQRWQQQPQPLAILGGGAAGVELALALAPQLPALSLLTAGNLLDGHPPALRKRALAYLGKAQVVVQEHCRVDEAQGQHLLSAARVVWRGNRAVIASGASALPWLQACGLACDNQGFVSITASLQSSSHPTVFAVGDCASLAHTPHNGVYAVRQGPVLAHNLAALSEQRALRTYQPQRRALALLATGDGGALASWAGLTFEGQLLGRWKDHLDQSFMRRHGNI